MPTPMNPVINSTQRSALLTAPERSLQSGGGLARIKNVFLMAAFAVCQLAGFAAAPQPVPDKLVVLTFDDAVKSHRTFVAPLLKELGFQATFFVTHRWMGDTTNFMTWQDIAEIDEMGFEIGNHSWTHSDFSMPKNAARLAGELSLVDRELNATKPKVPRPQSFGYCGNSFEIGRAHV